MSLLCFWTGNKSFKVQEMRIIVIGNGKVGNLLVEQLSQEGHDVVVIDRDENRLIDTQNSLDVLCIAGDGISQQVLSEAGIESTDLLISATTVDETNLLICLIGKKLGARHTIARVRNPELVREMKLFREDMGLSYAINPEFAAAQEIFSVLRYPGLMSIETFSHGRFEIAEFRISQECELTSMPLWELKQKYHTSALVCAIRRQGTTIIPDGSVRPHVDDQISFAAEPQEAEDFMRLAGVQAHVPKNVMIVGAGRITYYLVRMMLRVGMKPIVLENNVDRSIQFNSAFPNVLVIQDDGTDRNVLEEEGISRTDAFVALTGLDEVNVLMSMYASQRKVPKVVTKLSRMSVLDLLHNESIGSTISPRDIVASRVISYVRALENAGESKVETLFRIVDNTAEALEFIARDYDKEIIDVPLKDLHTRDNLLICALIRDGKVIIPCGSDKIQLGDHVIVVTTTKRLKDLKDILAQA